MGGDELTDAEEGMLRQSSLRRAFFAHLISCCRSMLAASWTKRHEGFQEVGNMGCRT